MLSAIDRNHCPQSIGITVRNQSEHLSAIAEIRKLGATLDNLKTKRAAMDASTNPAAKIASSPPNDRWSSAGRAAAAIDNWRTGPGPSVASASARRGSALVPERSV